MPKLRNFDEQSDHLLMTHTFFFFYDSIRVVRIARILAPLGKTVYANPFNAHTHIHTPPQSRYERDSRMIKVLCFLFDLFLKVLFVIPNQSRNYVCIFKCFFRRFDRCLGNSGFCYIVCNVFVYLVLL